MAAWDVRTRRIPDAFPLTLALLAVADSLLTGQAPGWREAALVFAAGFALFSARLMGGGDVKALTAGALLLPGRLGEFCFAVAVSGGLLSLFCLCRRRLRGRRVVTVPYGAAIAAGIVYCLGTEAP